MAPKRPTPPSSPSVVMSSSDKSSHDEDDELPSPGDASRKRDKQVAGTSSNGGDERSDDGRENNDSQPRRPPKKSSKDNIVQPAPKHRFWSPDDEITILKGLIDYRSEVGYLPPPKQLRSRVCGSLNAMATSSQFSDKMWQLQKKFQANVKRGRSVNSFANPHEGAVFDLSNQIWGDQNSTAANKINREMTCNAVDAQDVCRREEEMKVRYPHLWEAVKRKADEVEYGGEIMMRKLKKLQDSKASMAQKILEDLDKSRIKMTVNRTALMNNTFRLLDEGLNKKR